METIFTYEPTKKELQEILSEPAMTLADYTKLLETRAVTNNTSVDYERVVDLEDLFAIRDDMKKMNEYSHLLDTEFVEIRNRIFNE